MAEISLNKNKIDESTGEVKRRGQIASIWFRFKKNKLALAGGVASNSALRKTLKEECDKNAITFYSPSPIFCTDNAAMIGVAAYYEYISGTRHGYDLNAIPNLKLGERV